MSLQILKLTTEEFEELPEYSCSLPTGTTIGKRWKRARDYYDQSKGWWVGEYTRQEGSDVIITWYEPELTDEPKRPPLEPPVHLTHQGWTPELD